MTERYMLIEAPTCCGSCPCYDEERYNCNRDDIDLKIGMENEHKRPQECIDKDIVR